MDIDGLEQRQAQRYALLRAFFDQGNGERDGAPALDEVAAAIGMPLRDARNALDYLRGEGLVEVVTLADHVNLTHAGLLEVEESIRRPQQRTSHFTPSEISMVFNQTFNGPVGAVQTGTNNTASITQTVDSGVRNLIQQLRPYVDDLPEHHRVEASETIDALEEHSADPQKNRATLTALLRTLGPMFSATATGAVGAIIAELAKKYLLKI